MLTGMDPNWPDIGRAVRERRESLGLTQGVGGVSAATWRKIEKAIDPPYRRAKLVAIARALQWPDDAFDRMLAGRPPDEALTEPDDRTLEQRLADVEAEVVRLREALARQRT